MAALPTEKDFSFFLPRKADILPMDKEYSSDNELWFRFPGGEVLVHPSGWEAAYYRGMFLERVIAEIRMDGKMRYALASSSIHGKFRIDDFTNQDRQNPAFSGTLPEMWMRLLSLAAGNDDEALAAVEAEKKRIEDAVAFAIREDVFQAVSSGATLLPATGHWYQVLFGAGILFFAMPILTFKAGSEAVVALRRDNLAYVGQIKTGDDGWWDIHHDPFNLGETREYSPHFDEALAMLIEELAVKYGNGHEKMAMRAKALEVRNLPKTIDSASKFAALYDNTREQSR